MKNLLKLSDLSVEEIKEILDDAQAFKEGAAYPKAKDKIVANLFFEPSTRTHYSFVSAEMKLGCQVINFEVATSSMNKGESFYDTVKTFESFGIDALVIRSNENEYYKQLVDHIHVPILNAGDGTKDHPTQSLLDLLTIRQEFGSFEGLKIAIVGDIKHSRVAHTNIEVMERLGMECYVSGPEEFKEEGYRYIDLDEAVENMDVLMLLEFSMSVMLLRCRFPKKNIINVLD